jgi:hypothetical protein
MDCRYPAEERIADAMVLRWGLGSHIRQMRHERKMRLTPLLNHREPKIMQLLRRHAPEAVKSARERLLNLLDPELVLTCGYLLENRPEWVEEIRCRAEQWTLHSPLRPIPLRPGQASLEDELCVTGTLYSCQLNKNRNNVLDQSDG